MQGGGGHVTAGGALCMELLTKYVFNHFGGPTTKLTSV